MKKLYIILALVSSFALNAQNYGRVIVYTKENLGFLISFNGVRWSNEFASKVVSNYMEDTDYKVRLWFPRSTAPINFNITSSPGYETVYMLKKDQYDAYVLNLKVK